MTMCVEIFTCLSTDMVAPQIASFEELPFADLHISTRKHDIDASGAMA